MFIPSAVLGSRSHTKWDAATKDTSITLSNANLTAAGNTVGNQGFVKSANKIPNGTKGYYEVTVVSLGGAVSIGLSTGSRGANLNSQLGVQNNECGYRASDGQFNSSNTSGGAGSSYTVGDIIGVAYDDSTGNVWWAKNNVWQLSGNPATGANPVFILTAGAGWYGAATCGYTSTPVSATANFGSTSFMYTPPTGFIGF